MKKVSTLTLLCLMCILVGSVNNTFAQVELKTNILTLAVGVPNIGLEFQVGKTQAFNLMYWALFGTL